MRFILGITGPTGSGKTTACRAAADLGFFVIDCDKIARKATENSNCLNTLAKEFGEEILNANGALNRKELASKAFKTKEKTELLNKTIFPFITEILKEEIDSCHSQLILIDAPTLFESGADSLCDETCAILADEKIRIKRIIERDLLEEKDALIRINAGKSEEYYKERAKHILYNNNNEEKLYNEFSKFLNTLAIGGN